MWRCEGIGGGGAGGGGGDGVRSFRNTDLLSAVQRENERVMDE